MSSSESDDDCYGNSAQRLLKMKNRYQDDKFESTNLLNESGNSEDTPTKEVCEKSELPKSLKALPGGITSELPEKATVESPAKLTLESPAIRDPTLEELLSDSWIAPSLEHVHLPEIIPQVLDEIPQVQTTSSRRVTRSTSRKSCSEPSILVESRRKNPARPRTNPAPPSKNPASPRKNPTPPRKNPAPSRRSKGRSRQRGYSLQHTLLNVIENFISIGNTCDYPDASESQALFGTNTPKPTEDVVLIDDVDLNEANEGNDELSVKVYWQSCDFFKFTIRKFQKIAQIFEYFSAKENVPYEKLLFTYNEKILKQDDTPESIDYNIGKFIDGGLVTCSISHIVSKKKKITDGIIVKFQCQNAKKPFDTTVNIDERFLVPMLKCAEHLEMPLEKLKFVFDGELLNPKNTPRILEMEGDECIDVKFVL